MDDLEISKVPGKATTIEIEDGGALYIFVPENGMPPQRFYDHMQTTKEAFESIFPDLAVIVGRDDLQFTVLTSKQVFSQKLAGNL